MNETLLQLYSKNQITNKNRYSVVRIMSDGTISPARTAVTRRRRNAHQQLTRIVGKTTTMLERLDRVVKNELIGSARNRAKVLHQRSAASANKRKHSTTGNTTDKPPSTMETNEE